MIVNVYLLYAQTVLDVIPLYTSSLYPFEAGFDTFQVVKPSLKSCITVTSTSMQCLTRVSVPGFSGPNCNMNIDECKLKSPCQNNATCTDTPGSYKCECSPGFAGKNCEDVGIT